MNMEMLQWAQEMMQKEYGKIVIWLVFILVLMAVDTITGFIQAYANHDLKSGKMSTGILRKFALLLVLVAIVPLTVVLPNIVSVTVIVSVYTLEMINEFVSIFENLNKLGVVTNIFDPIMKRLKVNNETSTEEKNDYSDGQEFTEKIE
ncbi:MULTISPECIES: phage holin family protein [unclassified Enterococcus]|uniref:phage holin family protein n=1 Tax=unclassified Enterococcus TaxID=2608891 RepID=UPI003F28C199